MNDYRELIVGQGLAYQWPVAHSILEEHLILGARFERHAESHSHKLRPYLRGNSFAGRGTRGLSAVCYTCLHCFALMADTPGQRPHFHTAVGGTAVCYTCFHFALVADTADQMQRCRSGAEGTADGYTCFCCLALMADTLCQKLHQRIEAGSIGGVDDFVDKIHRS